MRPAVPEIGDAEALARLIDQAFDYRGDVTVVTADGAHRVGYLFNRDREAREPFIQLFPSDGGPAETIPYARIRSVALTGKDPAAGNSYTAWLKRKEAGKPGQATTPGA